MKVLITGVCPDWVMKQLEILGHKVVAVAGDAYVDEAKFCESIKGVDVYVVGGLEKCTANVIQASDTLKAIIFLGVDYKAYIDVVAAAEKNIPIFNTPGANARAVAELAFLLILLSARKATRMLSDAQHKTWESQTGFELQGKTLGLLGSGPIAQQTSRIGLGFGMNVFYWSRSGARQSMAGQYRELDVVFSESDILSLHLPFAVGTFIDKTALDKMQPHTVLINTCPAKLVDADALYSALRNNKLCAAAFDPFYTEGKGAWACAEAKLFELGNEKFFITPHAGWRTVEADNNMFKIAIDYIKDIRL